MSVAMHILIAVDEFLEGISNAEKRSNTEVAEDATLLIRNLELQADGEGTLSDMQVVEEAIEGLRAIWREISAPEKKGNHLLESHFEELVEHLEMLARRAEADECGF